MKFCQSASTVLSLNQNILGSTDCFSNIHNGYSNSREILRAPVMNFLQNHTLWMNVHKITEDILLWHYFDMTDMVCFLCSVPFMFFPQLLSFLIRAVFLFSSKPLVWFDENRDTELVNTIVKKLSWFITVFIYYIYTSQFRIYIPLLFIYCISLWPSVVTRWLIL